VEEVFGEEGEELRATERASKNQTKKIQNSEILLIDGSKICLQPFSCQIATPRPLSRRGPAESGRWVGPGRPKTTIRPRAPQWVSRNPPRKSNAITFPLAFDKICCILRGKVKLVETITGQYQ
jgi:hypothetical protein